MHFVLINSSPHNKESSNTAMLLKHFEKGITVAGSTYESYCLSQRSQWDNIIKAIEANENIVFALPVYAATIPGLMKEFLEVLSINQKNICNKNISFIVQSGFPEACQRVFCENYLETIPSCFESRFSGILSYGINSRFIKNVEFKEMQDSFRRMGECFVKNGGTFFFEEAYDFNGSEYLTEKEANKFNRIFTFFCKHISEERGYNISLTSKPYDNSNTK